MKEKERGEDKAGWRGRGEQKGERRVWAQMLSCEEVRRMPQIERGLNGGMK